MGNLHEARFLLGSVVPPAVAYPNVPLLNAGEQPPYSKVNSMYIIIS